MTPQERRTTRKQAEKLRRALADPWRELREIEQGFDPVIVRGCTEGMKSMLKELEAKLRNPITSSQEPTR